jgi:hypothetical protein
MNCITKRGFPCGKKVFPYGEKFSPVGKKPSPMGKSCSLWKKNLPLWKKSCSLWEKAAGLLKTAKPGRFPAGEAVVFSSFDMSFWIYGGKVRNYFKKNKIF